MQQKKNAKNVIFWRKKKSFASQMFIIQKFKKMVCEAVRLVMVNEIKSSNLFLSVKLWEEIGFLQDPQKAYIFHAIRFLYVSQKKSWNKLCLEPHDTYILFRTFFSHVNIKWLFFLSSDPLNTYSSVSHLPLFSDYQSITLSHIMTHDITINERKRKCFIKGIFLLVSFYLYPFTCR